MDIFLQNLEGITLEIPERYYLIAWLQRMLAKNLNSIAAIACNICVCILLVVCQKGKHKVSSCIVSNFETVGWSHQPPGKIYLPFYLVYHKYK